MLPSKAASKQADKQPSAAASKQADMQPSMLPSKAASKQADKQPNMLLYRQHKCVKALHSAPDDSLAVKSNLNKVMCPLCDEQYMYLKMADHMEGIHKLTCLLCHKRFSNAFNLQIHLNRIREYTCGTCKAKCCSANMLKHHRSRMCDEIEKLSGGKLQCKMCRVQFSNMSQLKQHWQPSCHCPDCKVRFCTSDVLREHVCSKTQAQVQCLLCCDIYYDSAKTLFQHLKDTHHNQCSICQRTFRGAITLHKHTEDILKHKYLFQLLRNIP